MSDTAPPPVGLPDVREAESIIGTKGLFRRDFADFPLTGTDTGGTDTGGTDTDGADAGRPVTRRAGAGGPRPARWWPSGPARCGPSGAGLTVGQVREHLTPPFLKDA
ncbi:hypothetical protein GCM10010327_16730 [Streptomyces nitrosporeus]|nr:hypothetical protein GCM10010327_16730 [Streptomyces nitrosporeus]